MASATTDSTIDLYVEKICCINNGGFVMDFCVRTKSTEKDEGKDIYTSTYPINQSMAINMKELSGDSLNIGAMVYPHVRAYGCGQEKDGAAVRYAPNGQVATYTVTGTVCYVDVKQVG